MATRICEACDDSFDPGGRLQRLERDGHVPHERELDYCPACADELFRGQISNQNVTFFGGRPPVRDDTSPSHDDAMRAWEDNQPCQ